MVVAFHRGTVFICCSSGVGKGRALHGWSVSPVPLLPGHCIVSHTWGSAPAAWTWSLAPSLGQEWSSQPCPAAHWAWVLRSFIQDTRVSILSVFVLSKEGKIIGFAYCLQTRGRRLGTFHFPPLFYPSPSTSPGFSIISFLHLTTLFFKVHKHKRPLKFFQLHLCPWSFAFLCNKLMKTVCLVPWIYYLDAFQSPYLVFLRQ